MSFHGRYWVSCKHKCIVICYWNKNSEIGLSDNDRTISGIIAGRQCVYGCVQHFIIPAKAMFQNIFNIDL